MSRLRIICTNPDGSVAILVPTPWFIETCARGGFFPHVYHKEWRPDLARFIRETYGEEELERLCPLPDGYLPREVSLAYEADCIARDRRWRPDRSEEERKRLARLRVDAMDRGGLNEREAVELIRDCDAPTHSTACEIVDMSDIPSDRTYRNAWRRSPNGGPIYIDQAAARAIRAARNAA